MPNTRTFNRSFAGGELSPEMFGRIDDVKYQTGAAKISNMIVTPQGPVQNRPGTAFVRAAKYANKKCRLIPFTYSTTQTMVIEIGEGYFRFHTQGATLGPGTPAAYNGATTYARGDLVSSGGTNYYCIAATTGNAPPNASYWYALPAGIYEIPNPYAEADLFDIHYVQSGDVLTLVHPNHVPKELRRLSATSWNLTSISFLPTLAAPNATGFGYSLGNTVVQISAITAANPCVLTTASNHYIGNGDPVRILNVSSGSVAVNGYWIASNISATQMNLRDPITGSILNTAGSTPAYNVTNAQITYATKGGSEGFWSYKVTAVGANGVESLPSNYINAEINLNVTGAFVAVQFQSVAGAVSYNVYKKPASGATANVSYGYIGNVPDDGSASYVFTDDNIAPDQGKTIPIQDTVFASAGNYPGAVSYYEQRRVFAGTTNEPQSLWMTRSNTESDMSYSIPTLDTDRIEIKVAAREANTIRHAVPLNQLVLLTQAAEWRVTSVNSDALTPTSVSVRPQSYIGASNVQPSIVNNSLVYCADRGGHVRELGYSWQANGFITGDLSLRATHLFDDYELSDMCYAKAPNPILWFISTNGKLLGFTYIPDQQIGAWHQHQTDGTFESCTVVAEGEEDRLYVVVKRTIGGSTVRYVERMSTQQVGDLEDSFYVDSGLTYDGTNTSATTMTVTGGTTWGPADTLTITASSTTFAYPATTDVNDAIVLTDSSGIKYRLRIVSTSSPTVASAMVDLTLPVSLRSTATTTWSFARDSISGLSHLEGKTVSILADGAVVPRQVVTSGAVSLPRAATVIAAGLPYNSDLQTLPVSINIEGFGQGRYKNVNKAWLRVYKSSGIFVGPDADNLVEAKQRTTEPYGSPPTLKSEEIQIVLTPTWAASGQVYVRQSDPLPLTIVGMTLEVSIGG